MLYLEYSTTRYTKRKFFRSDLYMASEKIGKYRYRVCCADERDARRIKWRCKWMYCKVVSIYTDNEKRGDAYRKAFFMANPKPEGGYRCRYCGKRLEKRQLEVDHIYPVDLAKKKGIPLYLRKKGITNINDPENLAAACHRCNKRKSNKAGIWLIKAELGKYPAWHVIRKIVKGILALALIYVLFLLCKNFGIFSYL